MGSRDSNHGNVAVILDRIGYYYKINFFGFDSPNYYFMNFIFQLSVPLNSLINPAVYIFRIRSFRQQTITILQRFSCKGYDANPINSEDEYGVSSPCVGSSVEPGFTYMTEAASAPGLINRVRLHSHVQGVSVIEIVTR